MIAEVCKSSHNVWHLKVFQETNQPTRHHSQCPNNNRHDLCGYSVYFSDLFSKGRVIQDFFILLSHHIPVPRHREIYNDPHFLDPVDNHNIWTIMFHFLCGVNTPIPPNLIAPILTYPNLFWHFLKPFPSTLYPIPPTQLPIHPQL